MDIFKLGKLSLVLKHAFVAHRSHASVMFSSRMECVGRSLFVVFHHTQAKFFYLTYTGHLLWPVVGEEAGLRAPISSQRRTEPNRDGGIFETGGHDEKGAPSSFSY